MSHARVIAGPHIGKFGPVLRSRGDLVWIGTPNDWICVDVRDMRYEAASRTAAVQRFKQRLQTAARKINADT